MIESVVGGIGGGDFERGVGLAGEGQASEKPLVPDRLDATRTAHEAGRVAGGDGDVGGLDVEGGRRGVEHELHREAGVGPELVARDDGVEARLDILRVGKLKGGVGRAGDGLVVLEPLHRPWLRPDDRSLQDDGGSRRDTDARVGRDGNGCTGQAEAGATGGGNGIKPDVRGRGRGGGGVAAAPDMDGAVGPERKGMEVPHRDHRDVVEEGADGGDLPVAVVAPCDHASIGTKPDAVAEGPGGDHHGVGDGGRCGEVVGEVGPPSKGAPGIVDEERVLLASRQSLDGGRQGPRGRVERAEVIGPPKEQLLAGRPCHAVVRARRDRDGVGEHGRGIEERGRGNVAAASPGGHRAVGLAREEQVFAGRNLHDVGQASRRLRRAGPCQDRPVRSKPHEPESRAMEGDEVRGGRRRVPVEVTAPSEGCSNRRAGGDGGDGQQGDHDRPGAE